MLYLASEEERHMVAVHLCTTSFLIILVSSCGKMQN